MIVFDLNCHSGHQFEVWFRSSKDYDDQIARNEVECPICGDCEVRKAPMAPNVGAKTNQKTDKSSVKDSTKISEDIDEILEDLKDGDMIGEYVDQYSVGLSLLPKELQVELETVLVKVQRHVEKNCEYVGEDFAEEARRIHYGEREDRGIYGEATETESEELLDEGINLIPLPLVRKPGPTDA
jgi:hypothetical protein